MFVIREAHKALVVNEQFSARQVLPSFPQLAEEQTAGNLYYASKSGVVVGTITCEKPEQDIFAGEPIEWKSDGPFVMIKRIAIYPLYQKHGIGKALISYAEGKARETGCKSIRIEIPDGFEVLRKFYEAIGFECRGTEHVKRPPFHICCFEKVF